MQQEDYNTSFIDPSFSGNEKTEVQPKGDEEEEQPSSFWLKIKSFFCDDRTRFAFGALLALIGAYLLIIFISYFMNGEADQSKVLNQTVMEMANAKDKVSNMGSSLGAKVSNYFVADGVGVAAILIVIWCFVLSCRYIMHSKVYFFTFTVTTLVGIFACSMIIGASTLNYTDFFFPIGGRFGKETNIFLINLTGFPGMIITNVMLGIIWILLCYKTIKKLFSKIKNLIPERQKPIDDSDDENSDKSDAKSDKLSTFGLEEEPVKEPAMAPIKEKEDVLQPVVPAVVPDVFEDGVEKEVTSEPESEIKISDEIEKARVSTQQSYDPTKELSKYKFPPISLLEDRPVKIKSVDIKEQEENKTRITETLNNYGIPIKKIDVCVGPTITLFEIVPADGVRISRIKNLEDDIALSLAALGIRIIAPIPGRGTIGIEVPNKEPQTVSMRSVIESKKFQEYKGELPMVLGCTISNDVYIVDLVKMPHLLVAGATGQGKSVGLNAIITSLLYKKHPSELKFVLIDPKMVEFSLYGMLEHHYLAKLPDEENCIITDPSKVVATLNSLVVEMENRYKLLRDAKERNVKDYNKKFISHRLNPEKGHYYMPYIVVIIDEFCDLIMMAGKDVEMPIVRIAQKARAVGIHMIIATQRPSTNVITGIIKANFPGRMAFRVTQMVDSRTILDCSGAQQLVGKGDMLFSANGTMDRIQCAFVDTPEVESICEFINDQVGYSEAYELPPYVPEESGPEGDSSAVNLNDRDTLFEEAAAFIVAGETASTSSLQRRYGIGYNRAGRIMDQMEAAGIVGPAQGGKPRKVLIDSMQLTQLISK